MSGRSALQMAMARIRLGRGMMLGEMAERLGMAPSELFNLEAGKRTRIIIVDQPPVESVRIEYETVSLPETFEDEVSCTFGLDADERRILAEGVAGRCEPPFPTRDELAQIATLIRRAAG